MNGLIAWLEAHDKLAGWAQFAGAIAAMAVTYLTVFIPIWRRKRQLNEAGTRLISHGYEAIESYHRALNNFVPFPISIKGAALHMGMVIEELGRFPAHELNDQGSRSVARNIVATGALLGGLKLFLEATASEMGDRQATPEEHQSLRDFVTQQLDLLTKMITNQELTRPWPESTSPVSAPS